MGRPKPWCQEHPHGRGRFNCRSSIPGSDAGAATRGSIRRIRRRLNRRTIPQRPRHSPDRQILGIHRQQLTLVCATRATGTQGSRIRIDGADNLASMKPRRSRDKDHLRFIARQPCTVCGRQPCEAHHLRFAQPRALGRRVSDEFTVPLCRVHHRELHRQGDERALVEESQHRSDADCAQILAANAGCCSQPEAATTSLRIERLRCRSRSRAGQGLPPTGNVPSELFDAR